jgi:hypothetical protein
LSAVRPAASRCSSSLAPWRPAEYITVSAGIFFPLFRTAMAPSGRASTEATVSPNLKVTARSRRWYFSASTTSMSQNSSIRSRCSTTVTLVPSAANMDAYSIPITPAPATTMDRGTRSRWTMPSESITVRSSKSTVAGRAGRVPVAITILSAVARCIRPWPSSTSIVCGSTKYPVPVRIATRFLDSWLRTTSISRPTTCWVRAARSATVMSSLTR